MNKKFLYLFLALALPGLIFVFLKKFGKNEFAVPVYFETGLVADSICDFSSPGPYRVADSIIQKMEFRPSAKGKLVVVYPFIKDDLTEVNRIRGKFITDSVEFVILSGVPNNPKSDIRTIFLDYNNFGNIVFCGLRVSEPWSVILLDQENRIRGFYDGSRGEMDRLDLELSILLKKY